MSIEKDLEPRQWLPYPGENAGVRSYDGGEGLHGSGSHMHCWFIQHAQQLQRKKWAQCTHGCYKMTWRYLTSEAISYDGQRPSSDRSSQLNQRAVTWFVIRVWIRASPYLLKILVEALAEGSGGGQESCHCGSTTLIQNTLQKSVHEEKCIIGMAYRRWESWAELQVVLVL